MDKPQFTTGDVVVLQSHRNVPMTVRFYDSDGRVRCCWFDVRDHLQQDAFLETCLQLGDPRVAPE